MTDKDVIATAVGYTMVFLCVVVFVLLVGGGAAAYAWNCFAPEMLDMPRATYRNGVGFAGFGMVCRALWVTSRRGQ